MKIIKRGKLKVEVYTQECIKCESILEFTRSDGKIVFDQRDGDYLEVICPVCEWSVTRNI